jgi:hypothetical protein
MHGPVFKLWTSYSPGLGADSMCAKVAEAMGVEPATEAQAGQHKAWMVATQPDAGTLAVAGTFLQDTICSKCMVWGYLAMPSAYGLDLHRLCLL